MSSTALKHGMRDLAANPSIFGAIVIRHGHIVMERYFNGSDRFDSNNIHSASKGIIQALLGIAVRDGFIGSLDDRVSKYLPEFFGNAAARKRRITIRQMISMSAGLHWVEDSTEYKIQSTQDWVGAVLGQRQEWPPGARFNYSTGNTHVLSALLQSATRMSTCLFAHRYLFDRIGITAEHWGRDPQAVYSGGYNLYVTPREMAKFGLLYLDDGMWNGVRVLPRSAVELAQKKVWQVDAALAYSAGWWLRTISGYHMYFAWGWKGQFIYVIPRLDIVFVTSEDTADGHRHVEIDSGRFIEKYLIPSVQGP